MVEFLRLQFIFGRVKKTQLKSLVKAGRITQEEYDYIIGGNGNG